MANINKASLFIFRRKNKNDIIDFNANNIVISIVKKEVYKFEEFNFKIDSFYYFI